LMTFFDMSYVQQYGINENKLEALRNALEEQPKSMVKSVLKDFFYIVYLKDIPASMFVKDVEKGYLDQQAIENFTIQYFRKSNHGLVEIIRQIEDIELQSKMVTTNEEITNFVMEVAPDLLPKTVTDIFLF